MAEKTRANIYQKLANINKLVDVLRKDASGYNYKYVKEEDILLKLNLGLEQERLGIYPLIVPGTLKVLEQIYDKKKVLKTGAQTEETVNETVVSADMIFRWVNLDDPTETLEIPWVVIGQQSDASQALGSGLSYCMRYFYLKFFHIATTEDDPDNWRSKQSEIEDEQQKLVLNTILDEINEIVTKYVAGDKGKATAIKTFLTDNNNNNPDYTKIKEIEIATALRAKLKEFVSGRKEE